jgi:hypothetical protein
VENQVTSWIIPQLVKIYFYFLLPFLSAILICPGGLFGLLFSILSPIVRILFSVLRYHEPGLRSHAFDVVVMTSYVALGHLEVWAPGLLSAVFVWQGLRFLLNDDVRDTRRTYISKRERASSWRSILPRQADVLHWIYSLESSVTSRLPGGAKILLLLY